MIFQKNFDYFGLDERFNKSCRENAKSAKVHSKQEESELY